MSQISQYSTQDSRQLSQESTQLTQFTQEPRQITQEEGRSHVQNVISGNAVVKPIHMLSFTTDNAKDISTALRGHYQWLGCFAHHMNLVIKEAFKKMPQEHIYSKNVKKMFLQ